MLVACDIEVQQATLCEPISGHVFCYTKSRWGFNFDNSLKPFIIIKMNLLLRIIVSYVELVLSFLLSCKNVS